MNGLRRLLDFEGYLPSTMALENTERLYLERQVTLARAVIAALSLVALLETVRGSRKPAIDCGSIVLFGRGVGSGASGAVFERDAPANSTCGGPRGAGCFPVFDPLCVGILVSLSCSRYLRWRLAGT